MHQVFEFFVAVAVKLRITLISFQSESSFRRRPESIGNPKPGFRPSPE
jgi:hypothetical protein